MSHADVAAVVLVLLMAPPATLTPICYGLTAPWWRSPVGWSLMASTTGLGLLVDISLLYQWLGDDYFLRDAVRLSVYSLILAGTYLTFAAWFVTWRRARR